MSEFSTLNGYKVKDKKAIRFYDTVASMQSDTTLKEGMHVKTKGYYSINDGGNAEYHITNIESQSDYQEELNNNLYATLIIYDYVTPEMFGAKGDGINDDTIALTTAIEKSNKVVMLNKTYLLNSQITIPSDHELKGNADVLGNTKLIAPYGIKIAGKRITLKNIEVIGSNQENYGLYCCGDNEGGEIPSANHFNQNIIENVIISNYNYGIYFNAVVWNNSFENIRINFCNYGLYNTQDFYIMTTNFNNVYFTGSLQYNIQLRKTNAKFNYCNFGISSIHTIQFIQNCNISIENSNFECDKYIDGTSVLIEITGKNLSIKNCAFKICASANMELFNTGSAVQNLLLENNSFESVSLNSTPNALTKIFSSQINGYKNGCINIGNGNDDFSFNIESGASRLPYSKYEFVRWHNLIQTYSEITSLSKLNKGDMVYFYQTNTIKYYNGTELISI